MQEINKKREDEFTISSIKDLHILKSKKFSKYTNIHINNNNVDIIDLIINEILKINIITEYYISISISIFENENLFVIFNKYKEKNNLFIKGIPLCMNSENKNRKIIENTIGNHEVNCRSTILNTIKKNKIKNRNCRICNKKYICNYLMNGSDIKKNKIYIKPYIKSTIAYLSLDTKKYIGNKELDVEYFRPIKQGDILYSIIEGYKNIIILDGLFYQSYSCTPFEILFAIENGINVIGGSSMGALRACELDSYGMYGLGYVYKFFKKRKIKPYHVVAQLYNEEYLSITTPLINLYYFLDYICKTKIIRREMLNKIYKKIEKYEFGNYSFELMFKIMEDLLDNIIINKIKNIYYNGFFNIKSIDAKYILENYKIILKKYDGNNIFLSRKKQILSRIGTLYENNNLIESNSIDIRKIDDENIIKSRNIQNKKLLKDITEFFKYFYLTIADISNFDFLGNKVFNIIFPGLYYLRYSLSSSTGYGSNISDSLLSGYMELFERISFCIKKNGLKKFSSKNIISVTNIPSYYNDKEIQRICENKNFNYIRLSDIVLNKNFYVENILFNKSIPVSSDGCSSGKNYYDTLLFGIYELLERDIRKIYTNIPLSDKILLNIDKGFSRKIYDLINKISNRGLSIKIFYLVNIYNIYCIECCIVDNNNLDKTYFGYCVSDNIEQAITRSIDEAIQSYTVFYIGSRDDYSDFIPKEEKDNGNIQISIKDILNNNDIYKHISISNRLEDNGLNKVFVYEIGPNYDGAKALKIIIPGLEQFHTKEYIKSRYFNKKYIKTILKLRQLKKNNLFGQ